MPAAEIVTFGCRLNLFESEAIRRHAGDQGDLVVINTCAVTHEAERQALQAVRRIHRDRPQARIVATGCAVQIDPAGWAALPGVDRVLGNREKLLAQSWVPGAPSGVGDVMAGGPASAVPAGGWHTRALVQVQQGCDHRCTFCIIPFGRGPSRSVMADTIVHQIRSLADAGAREVVITGVDVASYAAEGRRLGDLVRTVLAAVPHLPRLRLSSIDPAAIDDTLWALLADEPRLMPHLHLSIQAGSDLMLKRMRRRHSRADALAVIARARQARPGIAIGADLIAGFPTETQALFDDTLAFVEAAAIPHLHVFPYSERPGTPAARMPPVPVSVRRARAAALRAAAIRHGGAFHAAQVGRVVTVLAERGGRGHTEHFAPTRVDAPPGTLVRARVTAGDAHGVTVEAV